MRVLLLSLTIFISFTAAAQNFWNSADENAIILGPENDRGIIPEKYHAYSLDLEDLKVYLQDAPMERTPEASSRPLKVYLPLPDGDLHEFNIYESPVMKPGIAARFPHIRSYEGYSRTDQAVSVRFMYSDHGFFGTFRTPNGRYFIEPYAKNIHDTYIVFNSKDQIIPAELSVTCGVHNDDDFLHENEPLEGIEIDQHLHDHSGHANSRSTAAAPVELVEYEIAVAGVAEWTDLHGGTVSGGMSAVNTVVNLLNSVITPETAIRFVLIEDNDQLIYTDPITDPYNDVTNGGGLLGQNQFNLDVTLGNENYDIGHVMTIGCDGGLGGIAGGTVCSSNGKGRGVTCQGGSLQGAVLNIAVHEVAHQFTASHTWDNCEGSIGGVDILNQRASGTAFEPGSGSTIMSYAGACGGQNVQFGSDDYYHVGSLQQIYTHAREGGGSTCPDVIPVSNNLPELSLSYGNGFYIPISTPFELTAEATDEDNDDLTYCWEQYNAGPISDLGSPTGNAASFRSWNPTDDPTRIFPRIQNLLSNSFSDVEVLPTYTRNLTFRCTVRDNIPEAGGVVWEEVSFEATNSAGPFLVDYPNSNEVFQVGDYIEVLWDVANTDNNLVNCQKVNIKLSTDAGFTYPITLAEAVPNNGAHFVTIPNVLTGGARVKVEAADNIFFDISNFNSTIIGPDAPGYAFSAGPFNQQICVPEDIVIDLNTISLLDYDSLITFSVDGLPAGATPVFSTNPVTPSENATLTIDTENITDEGFFSIDIQAIAQGGDTLIRTVTFDLVINDFTAMAPVSPANGSSGNIESPEYTWQGTPNATEYEIQIASSPSFEASTIVETAITSNTSFNPTQILETSELYFWRIRAINECGAGEFTVPQAFHTEVFECSSFKNEIPANISGIGTPTIESELVVNSQGEINDLNVTKVKGSHDLVQHLDVSLVAPDNTEVLLFSDICGVATVFNLGLDDEAPLEIQCPPINGQAFKPQGNLSDFDDITATGIWKLKVTVNNNAGTGGQLEEWSIELCANASANAPFLVTNEVMPLPPGGTRQITDEFLLSQDDDNGPSELTYTVVTVPQNGTLFFQSTPLEAGMQFRQASLNAGNVRYTHDGSPEETDSFTFTVEDGEGGWFGTPAFEIVVDPDVIISTEELENKYEFSVFPNPAQNQLNLQFENPINESVEIYITNVQGQLLQSLVLDNILNTTTINTQNLTSGIYFIYVQNENVSATKKFVIQK